MTVSNETYKHTYTGDGSTTAFAFNFPILDQTHIYVGIKDTNGTITEKTLTTHYTVSGSNNTSSLTDYQSGTITFLTAPGATDTVIIRRNVPLTQGVNYVEADTFPAEVHEDSLDKLTMLVQQLQEQLDRALVVDSAVTTTIGDIPEPEADKVLTRNADNDGWEWTAKVYVGVPGTISDVVEDTSPQLGGNLDVNGKSIVSVSNGNITITPNGTGSIVLDGLNWPQADGTANQVLKTNGSGQLSWVSQTTDTGISNLSEDTTPQLGGDLDVNGQVITSASNGDINISPNGTGTTNIKAGGTTRVDITSAGMRLGLANARVTTILDEDTMTSDSATALATQQSIKAYVDNTIGSFGLSTRQLAKFWINMTGTGTIAINDSYNVSGIVDNGTGDYSITIDTDFDAANYAVFATVQGDNTSSSSVQACCVKNSVGLSTGSVTINTFQSITTTSLVQDAPRLFVVGLGDQ